MRIKFLLFIGFLLCQHLILAQSEPPEDILAGMAQKMADAVSKDPKFKDVTVSNFTKGGGQSSVVGNYLTDLFTDGLINASNRAFDFLPLESLKAKNPSAFADIMNTTLRVLTYDPNKPEAAPSQRSASSNSADNNTKTKFKKLDVVITGTITEFSEHFEVVVQALNHRQDDVVIARDRKNVPKTFHIRELLEKEKATGSEAPNKPDYGAATPVASFPKGDLVFNLLGCRQNGRFIECHFNITNRGKTDLELYAYGGESTKLFSAANGNEYYAVSIKLADHTNDHEVAKMLVSGSSIPASATFGNITEDIRTISKLELYCWGDGGYFNAEFRNITVKR